MKQLTNETTPQSGAVELGDPSQSPHSKKISGEFLGANRVYVIVTSEVIVASNRSGQTNWVWQLSLTEPALTSWRSRFPI